MIRLQILSGKMAGSQLVARRFPFRIGRLKGSDLESDDPGVWERHVELHMDSVGVNAVSRSDACLLVNDEAATQKLLRVGDVLTIGSLKLRFWLDDAHQKTGTVYQWLNVILWVFIIVFQVWLIARFIS